MIAAKSRYLKCADKLEVSRNREIPFIRLIVILDFFCMYNNLTTSVVSLQRRLDKAKN